MASASTSKSPPPKARQRIDAGRSILKRGSNGSAFVKCDSCNKDIPAATADMHDCAREAKTKVFLGKPAEVSVKEAPSKAKDGDTSDRKTAAKRKLSSAVTDKVKSKKNKREKDPSAPKRPPTAFFLFMDEFRKSHKEAHPDAKGGPSVAKEGGDKWKSMSNEEKASFVKKAAELKEEYIKSMESFKCKGRKEEGSDSGAGSKGAEDEGCVEDDAGS